VVDFYIQNYLIFIVGFKNYKAEINMFQQVGMGQYLTFIQNLEEKELNHLNNLEL
jgi:hypothetical protein